VITLGFDTATPSSAVALMTSDGGIYEARDDVPLGARGHHAESVLVLAAMVLDQAGLEWSDIEQVAVGLGPGGYTGLRIGIATARGLARAHGASLSGVGTLRALAEPAGAVTALTILDARRGELFLAAFADGLEVLAPRVIVPAELGALELPATTAPLVALGDGALANRSRLAEVGISVAPEGSVLHLVSASAICRLAGAGEGVTGEQLAPLYLRLPDAELALRASLP
jgi:tRNA threonylcarbamoyladenosine biosynthesis protein TsaB